MTEKLYQMNPAETTFHARVQQVEIHDGRPQVALDRTLFYPTSGGQPHDTGTLMWPQGSCQVTNVHKDNLHIWHAIEGDPPPMGEEVQGEIDWSRRFVHMQRHTAQHLLSQAFVRIDTAFRTVSVSFMGLPCTIDFEGNPEPRHLEAAEELVNDVCRRNLPITAFEVNEEDLTRYPVRRKPKVSGTIRLIAAGEWELAACGAPHLLSTAQALPIKILKSEHIRGDLTRVYFVAGEEALGDYALKHAITQELAISFSSQVHQLPTRVEALRETISAQKEQLLNLAQELLEQRYRESLHGALEAGSARVVVMTFADYEERVLKKVMRRIESENGVIFMGVLARGEKREVTLIRGAGLDLDLGLVVRTMLQTVEGRGGGRGAMARFATTREHASELLPLLLQTLTQVSG